MTGRVPRLSGLIPAAGREAARILRKRWVCAGFRPATKIKPDSRGRREGRRGGRPDAALTGRGGLAYSQRRRCPGGICPDEKGIRYGGNAQTGAALCNCVRRACGQYATGKPGRRPRDATTREPGDLPTRVSLSRARGRAGTVCAAAAVGFRFPAFLPLFPPASW
jgi:hypothetical protein